MSGIKQLDEMRDYIKHGGNRLDTALIYLDAIEAEIEREWMRVPVDADGVPVRVGDMVYGKYIRGNPEYTVMGYEFDQEHGQWNIKVGPAMFASANLLCHKPRTVEDVLLEFVSKMNDAYNDPTIGGEDREDVLSMILDDYAAELRELMGGSE